MTVLPSERDTPPVVIPPVVDLRLNDLIAEVTRATQTAKEASWLAAEATEAARAATEACSEAWAATHTAEHTLLGYVRELAGRSVVQTP